MKINREEQFYNSLLVKYGLEIITVQNYRSTLKKFIKDVRTDKPKREQAENYLADMRKKNYSYSHLANSGIII